MSEATFRKFLSTPGIAIYLPWQVLFILGTSHIFLVNEIAINNPQLLSSKEVKIDLKKQLKIKCFCRQGIIVVI